MKKAQKLYFGTNLKMYKTIRETVSFLSRLDELTHEISREEIELFVIPSYTALDAACRTVDQRYIHIGAQNMGWEDQGQFTGEISPVMLDELGVRYVMLGHSERRHIFLESNEMEFKKVQCAIRHGFTALLCVGETLEEKTFGISDEVLCTQLKIGLHGLTGAQLKQTRVAYEPVWAIGEGGIPASADYAQEKHHVIKSCLREMFEDAAEQIPVLYGGSVNSGNAVDLILQPDVDGLFIGRSAWQADNFHRLIVDAMSAVKKA